MSAAVTNCQFCGQSHGLRCPEVKAVEYNPDGTVKRVEFLAPADRFYPGALPYPVSTQPPQLMRPWESTSTTWGVAARYAS